MSKVSAIVWILVLCICIAPFLYFFNYTFPAADDYCGSNYLHHFLSPLEAWKMLYFDYNGRYTANFILLFSPMNTVFDNSYNYFLLGQFIVLPCIIYFFLRIISYQTKLSGIAALLITLLATACFAHNVPDVGEGIYWLTGSVAYFAGAMAFILHLAFFIAWWYSKRFLLWLFCFVTLIIAMGFNEVQSTFIPILYLSGLFYAFSIKEKISAHFYALAFISVVIAIIVYLAPGNTVRINQYSENFNWLYSIGMSLLQVLRFLFYWIFNPVYVLFVLITINLFSKVTTSSVKLPSYKFLFFSLFLLLFLSSFLPYLGTGILGQHRTLNWAYLIFIALTVIISYKLSFAFKKSNKQPLKKQALILPGLFLLCFFLFANGKKSVLDLYYDHSKTNFEHAIIRNFAHTQNPSGKIIRVANTESLTYTFDVDTTNESWIDDCMRWYFSGKGNDRK